MRTIGGLFNSEGIVPLRVATGQLVSTKEEQSQPGGRFSPEVQAKARSKAAVAEAVRRVSEYLGAPVVARFDVHAGCGMCPCSPGFRLMVDERNPQLTKRARRLLDRLRWAPRDRAHKGFVVFAEGGIITEFQEPKDWDRA